MVASRRVRGWAPTSTPTCGRELLLAARLAFPRTRQKNANVGPLSKQTYPADFRLPGGFSISLTVKLQSC